jgi:hypothetical protein
MFRLGFLQEIGQALKWRCIHRAQQFLDFPCSARFTSAVMRNI